MKPKSLKSQVDKLGELKAKISDLEEQVKVIRQSILDSKQESIEGKLFRVSISTTEVQSVDYSGLLEKLKPSAKVLKSFTTTQTRTQLRVTARTPKEK